MKKLVLIIVLVLLVSVGFFWMNKRSAPTAHAPKGLVVINVLDKELFDDCHIKHSINVPFDDLATFVQNLDKEQTELVVYCSNNMCSSSEYAYTTLVKAGFKKVWAYEGGMAEWYQAGLPVEGSCTSSYLSAKISTINQSEQKTINVITTQELAQKMGLK